MISLNGMTIVVVTHEMVCKRHNRMIFFDKEIVEQGTPHQIFNNLRRSNKLLPDPEALVCTTTFMSHHLQATPQFRSGK
jgi:energy-coupling factor transporter ATP-binding protein EcfA2